MKAILPWCVALALLAALAVLNSRRTSSESELVRLQADNQQMAALRAENEELKKVQVRVEELARLRKENQELHRLRNEVRQLREEKQQTLRPPTEAPSQAKADAQSQQQVQQQLEQLLVENERLRAENVRFQQVSIDAQVNSQVIACVNNLRQIDGAKQQWALENKATADAVPSVQDLLPYFKDQTFPACPSGGAYTVKAVSTVPTCSVAGHALH